jgi:predicted TPR repeat methyltransferase
MDRNSTLDSANSFAPSYDEYIRNCQWVGPDILFGLMYEYIRPGQTLLDIGIGTGLSSRLFSTFGLGVYGIDFAEEMLNISRNKGIARELKCVDLTDGEPWFENRTFDHIVSHAVFHLIGELDNVFEQSARLIKPDGLFGFTYERYRDSGDGYRGTSIPGLYEKQVEHSGILAYRHSELYILDLLDRCGFQICKKTEFLAFVDEKMQSGTYFNLIIAKKQGNDQ